MDTFCFGDSYSRYLKKARHLCESFNQRKARLIRMFDLFQDLSVKQAAG